MSAVSLRTFQTEDIEKKKLVYLHLINYAKTQPDLVILSVNTFVKDSDDQNPLIRALAIRTMGCIRVERIIDYLVGPSAYTTKTPTCARRPPYVLPNYMISSQS
jgi:vesicle coat complex subunit